MRQWASFLAVEVVFLSKELSEEVANFSDKFGFNDLGSFEFFYECKSRNPFKKREMIRSKDLGLYLSNSPPAIFLPWHREI